MNYRKAFREFLIPKLKFALTSSVATLADYSIYLGLTLGFGVSETVSHAISYSVAMVLNFLLQRRFIFTSRRKTPAIFAMSVMFSVLGWLLSQGIFNLLIYSSGFLFRYDILAKMLTTSMVFLYNFYTKRFSFERKYPFQDVKKHLK